jgi:nicotinamide N-methyltransferase
MATYRRPTLPATAVAASPLPSDHFLKATLSDQSLNARERRMWVGGRLDPKKETGRPTSAGSSPIINISFENHRPPSPTTTVTSAPSHEPALADELDYITVDPPLASAQYRTDKASRVLGIKHRRSMEPIPASTRTSIVSTRSAREPAPVGSHIPTLPLTSLYVVSGLPKSPHTWTLADPDSVLGLHHSEGAVNRWWRPEVLGSTVSPGAGGGKKKKNRGKEEVVKGAGSLSKQEVGKMLSKALKVCFQSVAFRRESEL